MPRWLSILAILLRTAVNVCGPFLLLLVVAGLASSAALAQGRDDQLVEGNAVPETADESNNFDANFDQWIFPGAANAAVGRRRLEAQSKMQLAEIERCCQLTDEQKARLELAARGDFQRFNERVEAIRRKFAGTNLNDGEKVNQLWQEIEPLQTRQARGITGPETLLAKSVRRTLDKEQAARLDAGQQERRKFHYEAAIGIALHTLDQTSAITQEQREKLTKLLLEMPPPRVHGQFDQWLVFYRLANLPAPSKAQALFDARHWQTLQQPLQQAKAMKPQLLNAGYLPEDLEAKPAEVRR